VNLGSKALKQEGDKDRVKCTQIAESTSNWRSRKPHVLFWKDTGIDGDDHLIAKAVYRLSSIGAAQRIALPGLSSVVQGHSSSFSPSLPRRGNFWLQSSIPMCILLESLPHLHYRCRGLAIAPRSPSTPNATESIFTSKLPTWPPRSNDYGPVEWAIQQSY
jgi:hypothetical protein